MNWIDFIIGLTLVNAIPHFVLGVWKGRMFSGLGFGNIANIGYSLVNFGISIGLFLFTYGWKGLWANGIYLGGMFVVVMYYLVGKLCYEWFHRRHYAKRPSKVAGDAIANH